MASRNYCQQRFIVLLLVVLTVTIPLTDTYYVFFLQAPPQPDTARQCESAIDSVDRTQCSMMPGHMPIPPFMKSGLVNELTDTDVLDSHDHHMVHDDEDMGNDSMSSTISEFLDRLPKTGYDSRIRPFVNGKRVRVMCSMYIGGISSVSESNMDFTADLYFRQVWDDHRLRWTPAEMDDHEDISIGGDFMDFLWRPDTFIPNAKIANYHYVTRHNAFVRIMPHGHVKHGIRITVTAQCPMDFRLFPMDHQKCMIFIESFSLPATDLIYIWRNAADTGNKNLPAIAIGADASSLPQFVIRGIRAVETYSLRLDGRNHSRLVVEIYLSRSLGYYLIQIYLPASLVVVISWVSFWISRHSQPARVLLGVTTVLTLTLMSNQGINSLPRISYLKALDLFMIFCFSMVFFALLEYAIVSYAVKRVRKQAGEQKLKREYNNEGELMTPSNFVASTLLQGRHVLSPKSPLVRRLGADAVFDFNASIDLDGSVMPSSRAWQREKDRSSSWSITLPSSLPAKIEWISRFAFPLVFLVFNIAYWNYFLSHDSTGESKPGFIKLD